MGIQEIITLTIVAAAALYSLRRFLRQFQQSDDEHPRCAKCEINKAVRNRVTTPRRG